MICKSCGNEISDNSLLCNNCGYDNATELSEEKTVRDDGAQYSFPINDVSTESASEDKNYGHPNFSPYAEVSEAKAEPYKEDKSTKKEKKPAKERSKEAKKPFSKKKKAVIIVSLVVGFLLILASVFYIFRANILMAVAPREYAAYCLSETAVQLKDDSSELIDTLLGFEMDSQTDITFKNKLNMGETPVPYNSIELSYAPSRNAASASLEGVEVYGETVDMDILWNDRIIGIGVQQLSDDNYYAVSSENFGKQIAETKLPLSDSIKEDEKLKDMDLSFSNIIGDGKTDEDTFEELKSALTDETLDFLRKGNVDKKGRAEYLVNGSKKSGHTLLLSFKGSDVKEYLLSCILIASNDEDFIKIYGENALTTIEQSVKDGDYTGNMYIHMGLYDDRVVDLEFKNDSNDTLLNLKFAGTKFLLNGFELGFRTENTKFEIKTCGNIMPEDGKVDYTINVVSGDKVTDIGLNLDFDKNKAEVALAFPSTDKMNFIGSCKMGNGISLELKSDDLFAELSLDKGARVQSLSGNEYMVLEKSTPLLMWEVGKIIVKSEEARGIVFNIAKDAFGSSEMLESMFSEDGGIGALLGR